MVAETSWQEDLTNAVRKMLESNEFRSSIAEEHVRDTPGRFVASLAEYFWGLKQDPKEILARSFSQGTYDEMVTVRDIRFVSFCAHHLVPFLGKVHFAYLPAERIVGLSKIPRLVEVFARRPQVQEKLTVEIADTFQQQLAPRGCGVVVDAVHLCMAIRGVKKEGAVTRTTALRGCFSNGSSKHEFLETVGRVESWM